LLSLRESWQQSDGKSRTLFHDKLLSEEQVLKWLKKDVSLIMTDTVVLDG
jgi:hypothetical protein